MDDPDRTTLSTTSYSILGYLAVRPFTAYELTKQLGRTFHHFWPRAESGIYRELKRLLDHGFVDADPETIGRRTRTRYTITDLGRRAVREWLRTPTAPGFLECEGLVRVLWADQGSTDDLRRAIAAMTADAGAMRDQMRTIGRPYLDGEGQFQERSHVNVMIARFLVDFAAMVDGWTAWADEFVDTWDDATGGPADGAETETRWAELVGRRSGTR
jgi:PadR family transcriptional regulator, regulatory protein AphA